MSVRWMAVQYVGDTLRIPVANESDMDRPFGSSMLERDVRRIVVNPFSDSPQVFVPEAENAHLRSELESVGTAAYLYGRGDLLAENAKLRDLLEAVLQCAGEIKRDEGCDACPMYNGQWRNDGPWCLLRLTMRELGVDE